ncbi:lipocalin family protein [Algoriphagus halophytocola]|uniref:Lipocalin family protein n=1 Tax=Algoriphagus halophytocola TaxID=2991499 RepID=A0ABY6MFE6_9BACT|nr:MULTISPECIES: lipocalin family protein [unclassified Algoriphagus]UZD21056.1 lipocalin family protein [Algoriphagus sp. TR-M5]WBL42222.1 lipocalin family protein [Algoriphagus sp. TR-M9]
MKIFQKLYFLFAIAGLLALGSCGDDEDQDPPKTDEELIGSGVAWKFSSASAGGFPITSQIPECFLDNTITFNTADSGNTGMVDAGPIKCDESEPQSGDFTWSYNEATMVLTVDTDLIDIPGATGDTKVVSVTENTLVLSQTVDFAGLGSQEVLLTLMN